MPKTAPALTLNFMNDGLLFAYELYKARREDWLRQAREHRAEERGSQPLQPQRAALAPGSQGGFAHRDG